MNSTAGTTGSPPNVPISRASSATSPASIIERRNRRRSSAISGPHPAEVPLTDSDQRLALTIGRINSQNAKETTPRAPQPPLPTLVVPPLDLTSDSAKATEEPNLASEKTPTQATFRPLSSERTASTVVRSHTRDGSRSTTTFHLYPKKDESDLKTPTQKVPSTSAIRAKSSSSPLPPSVRDEERLSPNRGPNNRDYELSPPQSPGEIQLSPYRLFTRRMYTSSPLESTPSSAEDKNIDQLQSQEVNYKAAAKSPDAEDVSNHHSPCESFPPFEKD